MEPTSDWFAQRILTRLLDAWDRLSDEGRSLLVGQAERLADRS